MSMSDGEFPASALAGKRYVCNGIVYQGILVAGGIPGGRWAYWRHVGQSIVVDNISSDAPHLAGLLVQPWNGIDAAVWVQIQPIPVPLSIPHEYYPTVKEEGRYERNAIDDIRFEKEEEDREC